LSDVAILGAGPIGAAIAHRLAQRGQVRSVLLIDTNGAAAAGKTLDIRQSAPIEHFDTSVTAAADPLAAAGATIVVLADDIASGEWKGEAGLALVGQLKRAGSRAPLVFAGPMQLSLMEKAYAEVGWPAHRLIGSAGSAAASAVRALAAMELHVNGIEVTTVGRPPGFTIGWSSASVEGRVVTQQAPPHRLLAISQALPRLWPPGPYAIGTASSVVVEALLFGSRRLHPALTVLDRELGARGRAVMLPLRLGQHRILGHVMPSLSPQEMTELTNAIAASDGDGAPPHG
jgi:malate dehydrogenase